LAVKQAVEVEMDLGLQGKVALVAAASKGLGFGVARALAREGAHVSICSRTREEVEAAAQRLRDETQAQVIATACDVTQAVDVQAWVDRTVAQWGVIDALLVNAGGPPTGLLKDFTDAQWQAAFELTLMSAVRMIRAALPHMTRGGAILTVTSSSVKEPIERLGLSSVMRSGVAALVKTLADELAGDGIRVNNLIPGRIDTDRVLALDTSTAQRSGRSLDEVRAESAARIPLKRMGTIDDFGAAGAFLLSPAASYITGATLRVDGGAMRSI
jgi:3-oxoacyl-[acyl-carrier protein] reductase